MAIKSPGELDSLLSPSMLLGYLRQVGVPGYEVSANVLEPRTSDISALISNQQELLKVNPRHFEELVAELLRADGYDEVILIPRSNAPGPDVIAICHGPTGQS